MKNWDVKKLRDLADIRVSNVDKKIYPSERPVKLCNYMDVYTNEYITDSIQFMEGSANDAEIERFGLNIGDVIITKDSETPDDIGIPTVIHEQIDNLVCGYHLALIRPDNEKLDSIFLSKYLSTSRVANYFALHASGSTRFGLPIGAIESVEILTPPKKEQEKIAEVLSTIDRVIAQTEAIIAKQQRIKTGLMQDLLTKGIDENGNIRSEATHEFKDSAIGRIPVEWNVELLDKLGERGSGHTPNKSHPNYWNGGIKWVSLADSSKLDQIYIFDTDKEISIQGLKNSSAVLHPKGTVILSRDAGVGKSAILGTKMAVSQHFIVWRCGTNLNNYYLYYWLQKEKPKFEGIASGSTIVTIGLQFFRQYQIAIPKLIDEQNLIAEIIKKSDESISKHRCSLEKLKRRKTGLMQDLLTGKVRVTNLLN